VTDQILVQDRDELVSHEDLLSSEYVQRQPRALGLPMNRGLQNGERHTQNTITLW
jgi:hypothetical protein